MPSRVPVLWLPEVVADPQSGRWRFEEEIDISDSLGQRAYRMRSATYKAVSTVQQATEVNALADHYCCFAVESAAVQQETVVFAADLSNVVRALARHTDAGLTQAWTEGHVLHHRVQVLNDQLGRLGRDVDALRCKQPSQGNLLTALQVRPETVAAAVAAVPDMATLKGIIAAEVNKAVRTCMAPINQRHDGMEERIHAQRQHYH